MDMPQYPVLSQEFNIRNTASILLKVEFSTACLTQFTQHPVAHFPDVIPQAIATHSVAQNLDARSLKSPLEAFTSRYRTGVQQSLMFPCPRLSALVATEGIDLRHQEPPLATGT
jgi:hypothetical protein